MGGHPERSQTMYICGLVIPVPADRQEAYRAWAANSARIFKDYGCIEIVESWEDFVPEGKHTDFRKAVAAEPGEKIVFTWQIWPSKEALDAAEERMHGDGVLDGAGEPPFDASRMILGCFSPIGAMGRSEGEAAPSAV
jgi:uncharacterized protein YbaA (DUF1428 family)